MKRTPGVAIALDNCAAIDIKDNTYRILKSKRTAKAYKVFWKSRIFHEQEIPVQKQYLSLESLLHKF